MSVSPSRLMFEREILPKASGKVLLVGIRPYCRYDKDMPDWETLDIDPAMEPEHLADICTTNLPSNVYDTVVCFGVIRYCANPFAAVFEMTRILKSGGLLLLGVEFNGPPDGDTKYGGDKWRFTPLGAVTLVAGFEQVAVRPCGATTIFVEAHKP